MELGHEVTVYHRGRTARDLTPGTNEILGEKTALPSRRREFEVSPPTSSFR
jgi:hypothetical protein